ncbi:MAG: TatD family hydrolase [Anaerolineales bacterium]
MLVDTHCHLDFEQFDEDRQAVVMRARQVGVGAILNPSVDLGNSAKVLALTAKFDGLYAAIGVHPNSSNNWTDESTAKLKEMAQDKKVVAIGEIGLDYYRDKAPKDVQQKVLREQLALAAEMGLPVIIHNRESSQDVLAMLLDWQAELTRSGSPSAVRPGVLHSFSGDLAMAEKAVAAHYVIGFTGPLTFKNTPDLQQIAGALPIESILIETDSPFLAPHPLRGKRNEPANVKLVAEKLAAIKNLPFEELAATTTANAQRLFRFGER